MGWMTFRKLLTAFLPLLLVSPVMASDTVFKGKVLDAETGKPLPGANIVVQSTTIQTGTASGIEGEFETRDLPPGEYTLIISFIGYEKKTLQDVILTSGERKELEIRLQPTGIELNPVTITASRHHEKLLEAPASISVLEARDVETRMALTATEHLKAMTAVDIISGGLNQSRVVIRGFNDLLSGDLLSLVDYRVTRIPAVRLNAFQTIPTSNDDVERIEIVSGPASALYGPNSANGVMHVITKSPFDSKGTVVSLGGGERSVLMGAVRHAGTINDKLGYKFSVQHYRGDDFHSIDSTEIAILARESTLTDQPDTLKIARRIYDIVSTNFDARVDFRPQPELLLTLNGGFSHGDNIEITDQGAAQALNAGFRYLQGRFSYKNLFVHSFHNKVLTDETYFLRNGQTIVNNSSLFAIQAQHHVQFGEKQLLTYGVDAFLTRPDTEGTVHGANEDDDDVNEFGAYLQSETALSRHFRFIAALRFDEHNRLDRVNWSPRAAVVWTPTSDDNFRFTFNRAFKTPSANQLFSDTIGASVSTLSDPRLETLAPYIGDTLYNIRSIGTWPEGFTFNYGTDGRPQMITVFGDTLAAMGEIASPDEYLAPDINPVWPALREIFIANAAEFIPPFLLNTINLDEIFPEHLSTQVPGILRNINPETLGFDEVDESFVRDVAPLKASTTTTFEVGYKGLLSPKFLASVDLYHTEIKDFIGPLKVETPSVFIDRLALANALDHDIQAPALIKNLIVGSIASDPRIDSLSVGIISPVEVRNGTDVILTYRNLGDVSVNGVDLGLTYYLNRHWHVTGNYSYVSRDFFKSEDGLSDIALNAPKHKFGAVLRYKSHESIFDGSVRVRFVDSFPALSGIYSGAVERYTIVDFTASYQLPFSSNTRLDLSIQNLMNNKHQEFVGLPEIGRLAWMRVTQML